MLIGAPVKAMWGQLKVKEGDMFEKPALTHCLCGSQLGVTSPGSAAPTGLDGKGYIFLIV